MKTDYYKYCIFIYDCALRYVLEERKTQELMYDLVNETSGVTEQLFIEYEHPELM